LPALKPAAMAPSGMRQKGLAPLLWLRAFAALKSPAQR
jgi:hypothetical protein